MASRSSGAILLTSVVFCAIVFLMFTGPPHGVNEIESRALSQDCTTALASDLYGLGVRLGVYFQWLSAWVSNSFIPDEIIGGLDANAMYLFALLISIVSSTSNTQMTLMDGLVLMWLCAGTTGSVMSLWGYRTCVYRKEGLQGIRKFGGFGTHLRLGLTVAVATYAIWYWTIAVQTGDDYMLPFGKEADASCQKTEVTVFGQNVQGKAQYFALTLSIIATGYCALQVLAAPLTLITRIWKMWLLWKEKSWASSTRLRFATGATQNQLKYASYVFSVFSICWMLFTAVAIEIVLNENYAIGVLGAQPDHKNGNILTPGQLLPMVIGAFSFVRILYIALEIWRNPTGDISPSLGRERSRRYVKAKRDSMRGANFLKMFSLANAEDVQKFVHVGDESPGELSRFQEMNIFIRIMITIVPHLSLFWSWPWVNRYESLRDEAGDEVQLVEDNSNHGPFIKRKDRTVTWEDSIGSQDDEHIAYDPPSQHRQ